MSFIGNEIQPTVDLARQRALLSAGAPGSATEAWFQDIFVRVLNLMGFHHVAFSNEEPLPPINGRHLWFDYGPTPLGQPGVLKRYDFSASQWVPMDPDGYVDAVAILARAVTTTTEDPPPSPKIGDWWFVPSEARLYHYTEVSPENVFWLDVTGGSVDIQSFIEDFASAHRGAYDEFTVYRYNNEVTLDGSSWRYIAAEPSAGFAPPTLPDEQNEKWVLSARRSPGARGAGYGGSSTSEIVIPDTSSGTQPVSFVVQVNLAYELGALIRVTSTAAGELLTHWFHGIVSSYDPETGAISMLAIDSEGAGATRSSWSVNLTGQDGDGSVHIAVEAAQDAVAAAAAATAASDYVAGVLPVIAQHDLDATQAAADAAAAAATVATQASEVAVLRDEVVEAADRVELSAMDFAVLQVDAVHNAVTHAPIDGLSFEAAANAVYFVQVVGAMRSPATTTGFALALSVPAGAEVIGQILGSTSAVAVVALEQVADNVTTGVTTGVRAANTNTPFEGRFVVKTGATPGEVQATFRSEVAASAVTIVAGLTIMQWRRVDGGSA